MAKITVKELYYGERYGVMGEVFKAMLLAPDKTVDEQTRLELEIVCRGDVAVVAGEAYVSLAVFAIGGDKSACSSRGPSVLVVEPREHIASLCVIDTGADKPHKLVAQVFIFKTRADVHMKSAKSHFTKYIYLTAKLFCLKI